MKTFKTLIIFILAVLLFWVLLRYELRSQSFTDHLTGIITDNVEIEIYESEN